MNLHPISAIFNGKPPYEAFGGKRIKIEFVVDTSAELYERFREIVGTEEEGGYSFDFCGLALLEGMKEWFSSDNLNYGFAPLQSTNYSTTPNFLYTLGE
jgi:hypothetical protein